MSLSFLAPLALLGGLLVAVPIFLHLIDRRRVPRVVFPAMRFLLAAQQRLRRRRRLRDPWLLLLRLLALLALVVAFSGPQVHYKVTSPAGAELRNNVVFLLDNSMSMGFEVEGEPLFERAKKRALHVLDRLPPGGRAGLIVFNRIAEDRLGGVTPDLDKVEASLREATLTYQETDLRAAILAGLRALIATPEGGGDLYLLSDMTRVSMSGEGGLNLPEQLEKNVRLVVSEIHEGSKPNRALVDVRASREGGEGGMIRILAEVSTRDQGTEGEVSIDLGFGGDIVSRGFLKSSTDGTVEKVFTLPSQADPSGEGMLRLGPDALPADNSYYFRLLNRRDLKVLVVDGDPGAYLTRAESFFVERALNPRKASGSRLSPEVIGVGELGRLDPQEYAAVFLLNVGEIAPIRAKLLKYVTSGGGLFISMGDRVHTELYNRVMGALTPASIGPVKVASPDLTGEKPPSLTYPEVGHPIFQVFREAGAPVFSTVSFYKVVPTAPTLKPDSQVLLKYSNGLPALLGRTVGLGRVLLFTSSLDRDWNDFPLKSIFLPFVQESTHYLARNPTGEDRATLYSVGQPVTLEVEGEGGTLVVRTPEGREIPLEATGVRVGTSEEAGFRSLIFRNTDIPGHYQVVAHPDGGQESVPRPELSFAVNVSPREKDLSPMTMETLRTLLDGVPVIVEGQAAVETEVEVERKQPLGGWLLWALLGLLFLESVWSAMRQRLQRAESVQAAADVAQARDGSQMEPSGEARHQEAAPRPGPPFSQAS